MTLVGMISSCLNAKLEFLKRSIILQFPNIWIPLISTCLHSRGFAFVQTEQARASSFVPSFVRSLPSPLFILALIILGAYYSVLLVIVFLLPIIGWALFGLLILMAPFILAMSYATIQLRLAKAQDQDSISLSRKFLGVKLDSVSTGNLD